MPKMKTNRGAAKRFKISPSGKIKRSKANLRHILTSKTTKQKRNLRAGGTVAKADVVRVKRMLAAT